MRNRIITLSAIISLTFLTGTAFSQENAPQFSVSFDKNTKIERKLTKPETHIDGKNARQLNTAPAAAKSNAPRQRAQQSGETYQRLDSIVTLNESGANYLREIFRYNGAGNDTEVINSVWANNRWNEVEHYNFEYDAQQRNTLAQLVYPQESYGMRHEYAYNAQNLVVSETTSEYDGSRWTLAQKSAYQYDQQGNMTEEIGQSYQNGRWVNDFKGTAEYDSQNRMTAICQYSWSGSRWQGEMKMTYEYGSRAEADSYIQYEWGVSDWEPVYKLYSEWVNGKMVLQTQSNWNNGAWKIWDETAFTYDSNGRITLELNTRPNENNVFMPSSRIDYTNTDLGNNEIEIVADFSVYDNANPELWQKSIKRFWEQSPNRILLTFDRNEYKHESGFWQYDYEESYTYNSDGIETESKRYHFDANNNKLAELYIYYTLDNDNNVILQVSFVGQETGEADWTMHSKFDYAYANGVETARHRYIMDNGGWVADWGEGTDYDFNVAVSELIIPMNFAIPYKVNARYKYAGNGGAGWLNPPTTGTFFWSPAQLSGLNEVKAENLVIYPNPVHSELRIDNGKLKIENVQILDVTGKIVNCKLLNDNSIDVSALSNGIYFIKIGNAIGKFIKE